MQAMLICPFFMWFIQRKLLSEKSILHKPNNLLWYALWSFGSPGVLPFPTSSFRLVHPWLSMPMNLVAPEMNYHWLLWHGLFWLLWLLFLVTIKHLTNAPILIKLVACIVWNAVWLINSCCACECNCFFLWISLWLSVFAQLLWLHLGLLVPCKNVMFIVCFGFWYICTTSFVFVLGNDSLLFQGKSGPILVLVCPWSQW